MEGLAPFLLFLFFMIINIYTGQKRREQKKKQKQEFPDIYDNPPPRQNRKRNLDYMMAKPKVNTMTATSSRVIKIPLIICFLRIYPAPIQTRDNFTNRSPFTTASPNSLKNPPIPLFFFFILCPLLSSY